MGTPAYMSPEQARADAVDVRTDVYSLGALFFEMLVGEPPYMAPNPTALLAKVLMDPPPRVSSRTTTLLPAGVDELVARAMAKRVDARTPNVATLRDEVRILAGRERLPSRGEAVAATVMAKRSVPPTQATPAAMVAAFTPRPPTRGLTRAFGAVAASSAVLLVAGLSLWMFSRSESTLPVRVPVATPPPVLVLDVGRDVSALPDAGFDAGQDSSTSRAPRSKRPSRQHSREPALGVPAPPTPSPRMPAPEPEIAAAIAAIEQSDWQGCLAAVRGTSTSRALQMQVSCALQIPERAAARRACIEHGARFPNHPFSRSCPSITP